MMFERSEPGRAPPAAANTAHVVGDALALGDLKSERLRRLHAMWESRRGAKRWPSRTDLRPEDIGFILGSVTLVDVLRDPLRFRMRLVGSQIEDVGRRGDQGKMLDDIKPEYYAAFLRPQYSAAATAGEPLFHRITFLADTRPNLHPLTYERALLPLSADGAAVNMLMVASDWPRDIDGALRKFHAGS